LFSHECHDVKKLLKLSTWQKLPYASGSGVCCWGIPAQQVLQVAVRLIHSSYLSIWYKALSLSLYLRERRSKIKNVDVKQSRHFQYATKSVINEIEAKDIQIDIQNGISLASEEGKTPYYGGRTSATIYGL
jgi:hypothetical protein